MLLQLIAPAFLHIATPSLPAAPDTVRYPVLNHGRRAGEMSVIHDGSNVVVRYIYTDRNRGQRIEGRYKLSPSGDVNGLEMRTIDASGVAGPPTYTYEISGDSARWTGPAGRGSARTTAVKFEPGMYFRVGGIPWETARLAQHLLKQPNRTSRILPQGTARLEIIADTAVQVGSARERVRLAMIYTGTGTTPQGVWIDSRGDFFATDVQWFITVRQGSESVLPMLRKIELTWR